MSGTGIDVNKIAPQDAQTGDVLLGSRGPAGSEQAVLLKIPTLVSIGTATTAGLLSVPTSGNLSVNAAGGISMFAPGIIAALGFTPYPTTGGTIAGSITVTGTIKLGDNQTMQFSTDGTKTFGYSSLSAAFTSTAPILLPADPTSNLQAATKQYVDAHVPPGGSGLTPPSGSNTVTTLGSTDYIAAWNTPGAANQFITPANFITQQSLSLAGLTSAADPYPSTALVLTNVGGSDYAATAEQIQRAQQPTVVTSASTLTLSRATHHGKLVVINGTCTVSAPLASALGDNFYCRILEVASGGVATLDSSIVSASSIKTMSQYQGAEIWATTGAGSAVIAMMQYGQTPGSAPGSVVSLASPSQTASTIVLTWAAGSGASATSWTVTQRTPSGSGSYVPSSGSFSATGGTVTGLTSSSSYDFQVVATNAIGSSSPTTLTNISTTVQAPGTVTSLSSTGSTSSTITLSWAAGSGGTATSWTVTQRTPSGSGSYSAAAGSFTSTGGTVTGLASSTHYDFQVVASNAGGSSSPATLTNIATSSGINGPSYPTFSTGSPTLLFHYDGANPAGHLYSDRAGTVQAVATNDVLYIKDLSPSGNHMVVPASGWDGAYLTASAVNGYSALKFYGGGSAGFFETVTTALASSIGSSTGLTVMAVWYQDSATSFDRLLWAGQASMTAPHPVLDYKPGLDGTGYSNGYFQRSGSGNTIIQVVSTANGGPASWGGYGCSGILRFNGFGTSGTPYSLYFDAKINSVAVTGAIGATTVNYNDSQTDTSTFDKFTLGGAYDGGTIYGGQFSGYLCEVMIWSGAAHTAASNTDVATLQTYINTKYGTGY